MPGPAGPQAASARERAGPAHPGASAPRAIPTICIGSRLPLHRGPRVLRGDLTTAARGSEGPARGPDSRRTGVRGFCARTRPPCTGVRGFCARMRPPCTGVGGVCERMRVAIHRGPRVPRADLVAAQRGRGPLQARSPGATPGSEGSASGCERRYTGARGFCEPIRWLRRRVEGLCRRDRLTPHRGRRVLRMEAVLPQREKGLCRQKSKCGVGHGTPALRVAVPGGAWRAGMSGGATGKQTGRAFCSLQLADTSPWRD
jgi:hypothetical protein